MRISDWSSDVCSSDLESCSMHIGRRPWVGSHNWHCDRLKFFRVQVRQPGHHIGDGCPIIRIFQAAFFGRLEALARSEEHTSELQSLMRTSYAVFCLKKKNHKTHTQTRLIQTT